MSTLHVRQHPGWDCVECGEDWPCPPAQEWMKETTPPVSLGLHMGDELQRAAADLPDIDPATLHRRFMGWLRTSLPPTGARDLPVCRAVDALQVGVMGQIGALLQESLAVDPVVRWIAAGARVDDIHDLAARLAAVHADHLLHCEDVRVTLSGNHVIGFLAGRHPLDPPAPGLVAEYERDLVAAAGPFATRYAEAARQRDKGAPRVPHYVLTHLVVHPDHRRRGVATGLLQRLHDLLDALGLPAHVAATTTLMRPLRNLGYELDHRGDDGTASHYGIGMWREAKASTPSLRI